MPKHELKLGPAPLAVYTNNLKSLSFNKGQTAEMTQGNSAECLALAGASHKRERHAMEVSPPRGCLPSAMWLPARIRADDIEGDQHSYPVLKWPLAVIWRELRSPTLGEVRDGLQPDHTGRQASHCSSNTSQSSGRATELLPTCRQGSGPGDRTERMPCAKCGLGLPLSVLLKLLINCKWP